MRDLEKQEQFELEVLDRLNSRKLLNHLVFGGGTMLRLCYGLNRFSVDLDFWIIKDIDIGKLYKDLKEYLSVFYTLKDSANKFHTLLFEIKSGEYPRSLKIEIRKEKKKIKTEQVIAFSRYANTQVFLRVVSLKEMMKAKIEAFVKRREIRDAFDMEFLLKKGIDIEASPQTLRKIIKMINSFTKKDYTVKLGSLLEETERKYYITENFKILKSVIKERLEQAPAKKIKILYDNDFWRRTEKTDKIEGHKSYNTCSKNERYLCLHQSANYRHKKTRKRNTFKAFKSIRSTTGDSFGNRNRYCQ
jgi:predicted nucleotidyltransferase component of viral defense system